MTRDSVSPLSRTDTKLETVLVLSFESTTDSKVRRVRYLACRGEETMWRIEERRCGADWHIMDTEPITELQSSRSDQPPKAKRHTDVGV